MRIGLYANPDKDPGFAMTRRVAARLQELKALAVIGSDHTGLDQAHIAGVEHAPYQTCDCIISLGGDGTFLSAAHLPQVAHIPLIGVNLGSVGFLPEIEPEHLREALAQLVAGDWTLEERMMLSIDCRDAQDQPIGGGFALNDAVVSRGGHASIVTLELTINDTTVDRIPGDGLIVSTPTGSTAYSLSSGGPIIHPELMLFLITPICPHTLHNRSYIASPDSQITIRLCAYPHQAVLSMDGRQDIPLQSGSRVIIRQAQRRLKVIRLGPDHFYASLPHKIHARGRTLYETDQK